MLPYDVPATPLILLPAVWLIIIIVGVVVGVVILLVRLLRRKN